MNIYVGSLSFDTTEGGLREAFSAFGEVASARVITDRETGRGKGFGFVEMPDDSHARAAIEGLDGKELDGRTIKVNESKPRESSGGGGRGPRW